MSLRLPPPLAALLAPAPSPAGPPDIRSIVPPQPYFLSGIHVFWLLAAGVLLALAALVFWALRRPRNVARTVLTPRQTALQRLRELEAEMETLDARTFGAAVADVLRVYVGAQYRLHPERQTSQEFLAAISNSRAFSPVEHGLLTEFLETCDLLKFARADATLEGKRRLLGQARDFLEDSAEPPPPLPLAEGLTLGPERPNILSR